MLDLIRGLDVGAADDVLRFAERDVATVIRKCLASAVANAQHNDGQDPDELYVSACFADEGPTLKRFRPRARGRATRIRKRTCHITVIVSRMSDARARPAPPPGGRLVPRPAARGGAAAAAASRRERVARSRQAAAAGTAGDADRRRPRTRSPTTRRRPRLLSSSGAAVTGELDEALDDVAEVDVDEADVARTTPTTRPRTRTAADDEEAEAEPRTRPTRTRTQAVRRRARRRQEDA